MRTNKYCNTNWNRFTLIIPQNVLSWVEWNNLTTKITIQNLYWNYVYKPNSEINHLYLDFISMFKPWHLLWKLHYVSKIKIQFAWAHLLYYIFLWNYYFFFAHPKLFYSNLSKINLKKKLVCYIAKNF